jgi:hypothetical protein
MGLKDDILRAAAQRGINPRRDPFKPEDFGLNASDYI